MLPIYLAVTLLALLALLGIGTVAVIVDTFTRPALGRNHAGVAMHGPGK
jgi:hypothetical protein